MGIRRKDFLDGMKRGRAYSEMRIEIGKGGAGRSQ
jgi:hypothetical protein